MTGFIQVLAMIGWAIVIVAAIAILIVVLAFAVELAKAFFGKGGTKNE